METTINFSVCKTLVEKSSLSILDSVIELKHYFGFQLLKFVQTVELTSEKINSDPDPNLTLNLNPSLIQNPCFEFARAHEMTCVPCELVDSLLQEAGKLSHHLLVCSAHLKDCFAA